MTEGDLFSAVANAEINFTLRQYDRLKQGRDRSFKSGLDLVFIRWLSLYYSIQVDYDLTDLFVTTKNSKPWRKSNPQCNWYVVSYKNEEKATMFKLAFG